MKKSNADEGSEEIRGTETSVIAVRDGIRAQNAESSRRKKKIGLLNRPNFFSQPNEMWKCGTSELKFVSSSSLLLCRMAHNC